MRFRACRRLGIKRSVWFHVETYKLSLHTSRLYLHPVKQAGFIAAMDFVFRRTYGRRGCLRRLRWNCLHGVSPKLFS